MPIVARYIRVFKISLKNFIYFTTAGRSTISCHGLEIEKKKKKINICRLHFN